MKRCMPASHRRVNGCAMRIISLIRHGHAWFAIALTCWLPVLRPPPPPSEPGPNAGGSLPSSRSLKTCLRRYRNVSSQHVSELLSPEVQLPSMGLPRPLRVSAHRSRCCPCRRVECHPWCSPHSLPSRKKTQRKSFWQVGPVPHRESCLVRESIWWMNSDWWRYLILECKSAFRIIAILGFHLKIC